MHQSAMQQEPKRTLTNDDVEAIAEALEARMVGRFYNDLGRGVWGLAWKGIVLIVIAIAAYGGMKGLK